MTRHYIAIETPEPFAPGTEPSTADVIDYLLKAIAVRQGDAPREASHTWWMRQVALAPISNALIEGMRS